LPGLDNISGCGGHVATGNCNRRVFWLTCRRLKRKRPS